MTNILTIENHLNDTAKINNDALKKTLKDLTEAIESLKYTKKDENPLIKALEGLLKHDCSTPLTVLGCVLAMCLGGMLSEEEKEEYLGNAKKAIQRFKDTLNNYNRSIIATMKPSNESLGATQEISSLNQLKECFPSGIRTEEDLSRRFQSTDFPVQLDPFLLKAILQNLADNALESRPEGSKVNFNIKKEGAFLKVEVRNDIKDLQKFIDNDIGSKLDRGEQVTSKTNRSTTNGTFLKTTRALLKAHGGSMEFNYPKSPKDPNRFFTVTLNYPLQETSEI